MNYIRITKENIDKEHILSNPKHLAYKGFKVADISDAGIHLMYLPFDDKSDVPQLKECAKHPRIDDMGYVLYYTNQCPFTSALIIYLLYPKKLPVHFHISCRPAIIYLYL